MGDDGREGGVRGREEGEEGEGGGKRGGGRGEKRRGREFCARKARTAPRREERDKGVGGGDRGREGEKPTPLSTPSNIGGQWEKADSFNCTL